VKRGERKKVTLEERDFKAGSLPMLSQDEMSSELASAITAAKRFMENCGENLERIGKDQLVEWMKEAAKLSQLWNEVSLKCGQTILSQ
jgi:hypothetical protein